MWDNQCMCDNHVEIPICKCGKNRICRNCGQGNGALPCACSPQLRVIGWSTFGDPIIEWSTFGNPIVKYIYTKKDYIDCFLM
jgi:hypothetical protein